MGKPRILVIDGNRAATREQQVAAGGQPSGEGYVRVLQQLAPLDCDIVRPADGEVQFPAGVGLGDYDGAAITGSALNVYDGGVHIERQIELARAVLDEGVPCFGSCWGMQVAVTALGGRVRSQSTWARVRICASHRFNRVGPPTPDVPREAGSLRGGDRASRRHRKIARRGRGAGDQ